MSEPGRNVRTGSMRLDLASAYLAGVMRLAGWVLISAVVFRRLGADAFAILALIRATTGLLNYVTIGLPQALIHYLPGLSPTSTGQAGRESDPDGDRSAACYGAAHHLTMLIGIAAVGLIILYAALFDHIHVVPVLLRGHVFWLVCFMGAGLLARLMGDNSGAVLQTRGRIAWDNFLLGGAELLWVCLSVLFLFLWRDTDQGLMLIGLAYCLSNLLVAAVRGRVAGYLLGRPRLRWKNWNSPVLGKLLAFGALVVLSQLADYLYAPADYILINRLLHSTDLAGYVPALQIDAGLMLLVTAIGAVLLPKSAIAHAAGDARAIRNYYVRGTWMSLALLVPASIAVWVLSPWIFTAWLGNPMPTTQAILPLVLIHSVIGGSSAAGRGILIGMGRVRAFSLAALASGILNVILGYVFVRYARLGLSGIVLATIIAVALRCIVWMPWYVLRVLREPPAASSQTA